MRALLIFISLLFIPSFGFAQEKLESDIDYAYQNAKKGIYWTLTNIPEKKTKIEKDLIADDRLYAEVKLYKEVNGVKIMSTGYYHSNKVTITIYKSYDTLEKEGYVKLEGGND
jgi:hypothetical protein